MLNLLIPAITGILDKVIPDKTQAQQLAHEIATLTEKQAHEIALAQIKVNQEEAKQQSLFVSGWRPATGWVCVVGLSVNYICIPIGNWFGYSVTSLDMATMMPVLMGMLGLGGLRTIEKTKGVARN